MIRPTRGRLAPQGSLVRNKTLRQPPVSSSNFTDECRAPVWGFHPLGPLGLLPQTRAYPELGGGNGYHGHATADKLTIGQGTSMRT